MARSYNGHYVGLSIRSQEFDSPTSRQVLLREVQAEPNGLISHVEGGALPSPATKISPAMAMTDNPYSVIHTSAR